MVEGLRHGRLGDHCLHICVDMQQLFGPQGPWPIPWMQHILPGIIALTARQPSSTIFTRFIPAQSPQTATGTWARYYARWPEVTRDRIAPRLLDLMPELMRFVPMAQVLDKSVYSPWLSDGLDQVLQARAINTLVITGGESDLCVLDTVMGAVNRGYRTVIVSDAICGSADLTHDAAMTIYASRLSEQIELAPLDDIIRNW